MYFLKLFFDGYFVDSYTHLCKAQILMVVATVMSSFHAK